MIFAAYLMQWAALMLGICAIYGLCVILLRNER